MSKLSLKVPPVAQGVVALIGIWLLSRYGPVYRMDFAYQEAVSLCIILLGGLFGVLGISAFVKLRTTVDPRYPDKASRLVVVGIYRYSRNPMYLALLLVLMGAAVYLGALSSFFAVLFFGFYIHRYQIVPEEQILDRKFGDDYRKYARRVRRWI